MTVLTMRLAAPMQSWGTGSRFTRRTTDDTPSKSGILGMLAAARGLRRTDAITDLLQLTFGVRIDQPGVVIRDFHFARSLDGSRSMPLSQRFYRADAVYVAAVEGPHDLLDALAQAIRRPVFPLFLGRRSCPPAGPLDTRLHDSDIPTILRTLPWQAAAWHARNAAAEVNVEAVCDTDSGGDLVRDEPISFNPAHRQYGWRQVTRIPITLPNPHARKEHAPIRPSPNEPDFMSHLE